MRNTKVVDIISELKTYNCNIDVYDPWVDPGEEKQHYTHGIISNPFKNSLTYDAIVVAVAHKQFMSLTERDFAGISQGLPIVMDIKGIVENPSWRL